MTKTGAGWLAQRDLAIALSLATSTEGAVAAVVETLPRFGWVDAAAFYRRNGGPQMVLAAASNLSDRFLSNFRQIPVPRERGELLTEDGVCRHFPADVREGFRRAVAEEGLLSARLLTIPNGTEPHAFLLLGSRTGEDVPPETAIVLRETARQVGLTLARIGSADHLRRKSEEMEVWLAALQHRNREMGLLFELGHALQEARTMSDARRSAEALMPRIFHAVAGVFALVPRPGLPLEVVSCWGEGLPRRTRILADECWGLRLGRPHLIDRSERMLVCGHLGYRAPSASLCVPVQSPEECFGVLQLESAGPGGLGEGIQRLAVAVAEHVSLSLSNIRLRETLREQATHDALTGLFNRRFMEETLDRELVRAARRDDRVGLLMIDLDHFKNYNDSFGHECGDRLLHGLAQFVLKRVRAGDVLCRWGGEEFLVVLPEAGRDVTAGRAEQLVAEVREFRPPGLPPVTVSIGSAVFPDDGIATASLLRAADAALYRAKARGRDRAESAWSP